eukprot:3418250-Rhodomonas_salina.1
MANSVSWLMSPNASSIVADPHIVTVTVFDLWVVLYVVSILLVLGGCSYFLLLLLPAACDVLAIMILTSYKTVSGPLLHFPVGDWHNVNVVSILRTNGA